MKKICFVLALVLMISSLGIAPVFAAEDITVVDTMDGTERSSVSYASASVKSGDTTETITTGFTQSTGAAPQKNADDNALYVSGTATYTSTALSVSTGRDIYNVKNKTKGTHYADFTGRTYNEFSFDVYVGKDDKKGFIPIYVNCGGISRNFYLCTNDLYSDDAAARYKSITGTNGGWIFYGLEREKWARVTVTHTMAYDTSGTYGNGTAKFTLYINGTEIPTAYAMSSKTGQATPYSNTVALDRGKTVTGTQFSSQLSMCNNTGDVRDFYIDNVTYKASDTTAIVPGAAATIATADENGIVTVEDGALANSITATGATVEIYRKNSKSETGYDYVEPTAALATNDIIKLTSTNGVYSYYTVKLNRVAVPFAIGNLTAPEAPVQGGQITSSLALSGDAADKNVTLILALYKGITLCDMKTAEINSGDAVSGNLSCTIDVPDVSGNYTAKAFVWSDKDTMIQYK